MTSLLFPAEFSTSDSIENEGFKRRRSMRDIEDSPFKKFNKQERFLPLQQKTNSRCSSPTLMSSASPRCFFEEEQTCKKENMSSSYKAKFSENFHLEMNVIHQFREQVSLERSQNTSGMSAQNMCRIYQQECSKILPNIYLGSHSVAKDSFILEHNKISHILNLSSLTAQNYYPQSIIYKSWPLLDDGNQSIISIIIESIYFIEEALSRGGNILIHCEKGVSRSACILIGYLMWKNKSTFQKCHDIVKNTRPIISPNAGFVVQLFFWEKMYTFPSMYLFQYSPLNAYSNFGLFQLCNQLLLSKSSIFIAQDSIECWKYDSNQDILIKSIQYVFNLTQVNFPNQKSFEKSLEHMNQHLPPTKMQNKPIDSIIEDRFLQDQKRIKIYEFDETDEYWEDCGSFSLDEFEEDHIYVVIPPEDDEFVYVWINNDNDMAIHQYGHLFCQAKCINKRIKRFYK